MTHPFRSMHVSAVLDELSIHGLKGDVGHRAKHIEVRWTDAGGEKFYICPTSSSDRRAHLNARCDVRRMIQPIQAPETGVTTIRVQDGEAIANSRDVADHFEKRHDHVLRDIDNLLKDMDSPILGTAFRLAMKPDGSGVNRRTYDLTRDGFALLAMGFTGSRALKWKLAYIEAFNTLERAVSRPIASDEVSRLRGDLEALTDIVLSLPNPEPVVIRKAPFVRPSILRRMRRAA